MNKKQILSGDLIVTPYGRNKNPAYEIKSQEKPNNNPSLCFEAIEQKKVSFKKPKKKKTSTSDNRRKVN